MNLPNIGDRVCTGEALELCKYFNLDYLVDRVESDPELKTPAAFSAIEEDLSVRVTGSVIWGMSVDILECPEHTGSVLIGSGRRWI